jgi:hypothetical protein
VTVDISPRKTKNLKQKIIKSFYSFGKTGDYEILRDRLVFLSSNRDMVDKAKKRKFPTGVYYSYAAIDFPSDALKSIDRLLRVILTKPQGRFAAVLAGKLTPAQRKELLKITFSSGHAQRKFKRFSPNRLSAIVRIF